jgi:hypothetical protein
MTIAPSFVDCGEIPPENVVGAFVEIVQRLLFACVLKVFVSISFAQDAPRALSASNRRRASTRLARPKSENNWAVFFASPR